MQHNEALLEQKDVDSIHLLARDAGLSMKRSSLVIPMTDAAAAGVPSPI